MDQTQPQPYSNSDTAWVATPPAQALTLKDGSPLYQALLDDPNPVVLDKHDAEKAKSSLAAAIAMDEETVRGLSGATYEQARQTLQGILARNTH